MNTYLTVICLSAFAAVVSTYPPGPLPLVPVATIDEQIPHYKFDYAVNDPSTGDNKAQWESRLGDVVHGAYTLMEPDGNRRLVEYTADPMHGFNAVVKRTGPQIHSITPVVTKIASVAHIEPVGHVEHIAAPIQHITEPIVDYASAHITPVIPGPVITPVIETEPVVVHQPDIHIMPVHSSPWLTLSGTTYGHKGIVRRWAAEPISLDGKTLRITTKHY